MMAYITYFNFFVRYNLKYTVGTRFSHFDALTQALSSYYYISMLLCQAKYCCFSISNVSAHPCAQIVCAYEFQHNFFFFI